MAKKELDRFDKNGKRDMQIKTKLIAIFVGAIVGCVVGTLSLTLIIFNNMLVKDTETGLGYTANGVEAIISDWESSVTLYTRLLSQNTSVASSLSTGSTESLREELRAANATNDVDFIAITDARGNVAAGAGGLASGGSIAQSDAVKAALNGKEALTFDTFGEYEYAIAAASPVKLNGEVVGCVVAGYDMTTNTFVDLVKSSYNVECTVLKGDLRVATTLGQNMVGVRVTNTDVTRTVLTRGEQFKGETKIEGNPYYAIYHPIVSENAVTGMIFVAKSMAVIESTRNRTLTIVTPIVLIAIVIILILLYSFVRWLMWRIYNVTNFLQDLEMGDADLTKRCKLFIRDEIGDLIVHFDLFLDKLQEMVKQLKISKGGLSDAGTTMAASSEDVSGSITQIVANINGITNQIREENNSVNQTADAVDDISRGINQLDNMIETQVGGVSEASSAIDEMMGNITSVNTSVDKMASSFEALQTNARMGFDKQQSVNEQIKQIEGQSVMLQEANSAISNIAEQTNLLAMNAAIEAAHAGEAGKGFSVVADEIRKLSETSSAQSKTIGEQLNKIKEAISQVVSASSESSAAFSAVSKQIEETDQIVSQIKAAMQEQNEGSRQINRALHDMNEITGEVRNASKEMARKNSIILTEMSQLRNVTSAMKHSMEEMSNGAHHVSDRSASLMDISGTMHEAISKIGNQIDLFKV